MAPSELMSRMGWPAMSPQKRSSLPPRTVPKNLLNNRADHEVEGSTRPRKIRASRRQTSDPKTRCRATCYIGPLLLATDLQVLDRLMDDLFD